MPPRVVSRNRSASGEDTCVAPTGSRRRCALARTTGSGFLVLFALIAVVPARGAGGSATGAAEEPPPAAEERPSLVERIPGLRAVPTRVPGPGAEPWGTPPEEGVLELDLARAVDLALERNPALRAAEEQIDEVIGGVEEARAEAFPQIAAVGSYSRSRNPAFLNNPDFEDIVEQFPGGDFEPSIQELWSGSVEVSQPLYTFGKIRAAIELARLVGGTVDAQIEAARLETALAAAETYYDLLAAEQAVVVVEAQQRARRGALEVVEARYEIGEATRLELLRSRSALAELGPDLATRQGDVDVARSRLRVTLGLPPSVRVEARRSDRDLPAALELSTLRLRAYEERPELADLAIQRESLEKRQQITRSDGLPQIELNGSYGRQVRLPENFTDPLFADWSFSVGMRWELFDGGRRKGQIAQLESQRQQLGWQLRELEDQIALEIETALSRYRAALERLEAAEVAAETAREAARVAEETYREGVSLQADLLDAQQEEVAAEIERIAAILAARTEAARLARAIGEYPTERGWAGEAARPANAPEPTETSETP